MERLFSKGESQSASAYPLRMVYIIKERQEGEEPVEVLVSVSKRHFKRAVKRNRVKRQIREAYRHRKHLLISRIPEGKMLAAAFIWQADDLMDSRRVGSSMERLIEKVAERL
jgi:ribonuclease P protein component